MEKDISIHEQMDLAISTLFRTASGPQPKGRAKSIRFQIQQLRHLFENEQREYNQLLILAKGNLLYRENKSWWKRIWSKLCL